MKKILILTCFFACSRLMNAQGFNGSIEFVYFNGKDTTTNVYLVKNKVVKLDQYTKKTSALEGSFIFDLGENKIKFINPKRKVWGEHKSETPPVIHGQCEVTRGSGHKTVAGIKCKEYTVKNTEENTIINYWVADHKFTFFSPMIKLWNRKDKQSIYYAQIKDLPEGCMPLLSEEKQLSDNKIVTRLEVTKITNKVPEEASMAIPSGFTKFE